jgi:hypothetical protein
LCSTSTEVSRSAPHLIARKGALLGRQGRCCAHHVSSPTPSPEGLEGQRALRVTDAGELELVRHRTPLPVD